MFLYKKGYNMSKKIDSIGKLIENWMRQLRKGTLELAILSFIEKKDEDIYGYNLIKDLKEGGIDTDGNTVYPILRRLENNKLIESIWITIDNKPKKFFKITTIGKSVLNELRNKWIQMNKKFNLFIEKEV